MDEDSGYDWLDELDEEPVAQILDEHDTVRMDIPFRACTSADWPPEPPLPAEVDLELAAGTIDNGVPPPRTASIFAAVRRPTTSNDTNDDDCD